MAANAVTLVSPLAAAPPGSKREVLVKVTPSTSYPNAGGGAGGEVITAAQLGLTTVEGGVAGTTIQGAGTVSRNVATIPNPSGASIRFVLVVPSTGAEVANAVDVSSFTFHALVFGT